jgi:hypothetical protein
MASLSDSERHVRVTVSTLDTEDIVINPRFGETQLAVGFNVTKTMDPEPSLASITIADLARTTRERLSGVIRRTLDVSTDFDFVGSTLVLGTDVFPNGIAREVTFRNGDAYVTLEAGNGPGIKQVFEGSGGKIRSGKVNPGWETSIEAGDGQSGDISALSNKYFDWGAPMLSVLRHLLVTWGVGFGNLNEQTLQAVLGDRVDFPDGFHAVGHPRELIAGILQFLRGTAAHGQLGVNPPRWFIDDGEFYLIAPDGFLPLPPLELAIDRPRAHRVAAPAGVWGHRGACVSRSRDPAGAADHNRRH